MDFSMLKITGAGLELLARNLAGETGITFDSMVIGSGVLTDLDSATALANLKQEAGITSMSREDTILTLTATFDNTNTASDFVWTEVGVMAYGEGEDPILFGYAASESGTGSAIPANDGTTTIENVLSIQIYVGAASNVSVSVKSMTYATKEELSDHAGNTNNPHNVTKDQVGLGNVPNVTTNNQTPTYQSGTALEELKSGETMSVAMKKIAYAVKTLIAHLKSIVPIALGGTGASTAEAARNNLGCAEKDHDHLYAGAEKAGGSAKSAEKLETSRTIRVKLSSTTATGFDGTANITPGVTGTLGIGNGGTGATTGNGALKNMFAAGKTVLSSYQYGTSLPSAGTAGRIFFKIVE